jgi:hypothetical protein
LQNNFGGGGDIGVIVIAHALDETDYVFPHDIHIRGNTFEDLTHYGIELGFEVAVDEFSSNKLRHISSASQHDAVAIRLDGTASSPQYAPVILKARNNPIVNNDNGLYSTGNPIITGLQSPRDTIDFGNPNQAGGNVFACNSVAGGVGYDVLIDYTSDSNGTFNLSGNFWDHPKPSLAEPATGANGQDLVMSSATHVPPMVTLDHPQLTTVTCDGGRTPGPP